jgi:O-acetyl-ADP-ribose deacetylase (regulator of RNase III)
VGPAMFSTIALITGDFHLAFAALAIMSAAATVLLMHGAEPSGATG